MSENRSFSYFSIIFHSIMGLLLFLNLLVSAYALSAPDRIKKTKISKLKYGAVKVAGRVKRIKYGQVDFSTVTISDGTGEVKVLYGLYNRIEDPKKIRWRENLNVKRMTRKEAINALNKPVYYDNIEVVGIYYPFLSLMHAYYLNGQIGVVEFLLFMINFILVAYLFYSVIVSILRLKQ